MRNIRDTCNNILQCHLTTLSPLYSSLSSPLRPFFLHLWFSEMQIENRAMFPTNSSCRWIQRRWKKSVSCSTTNGRSARRPIDRDRERYTGTLVAPRKRSMSLLAGSWRSTELASTLKRKLNEISNRQELPRIGPIKPPPVPRTCTRVY